MKYLVIETPSCERSQVIKKILESKGMLDKVVFIPYSCDQAVNLMTKHGAMTGAVLNADTGEVVKLQELIGD